MSWCNRPTKSLGQHLMQLLRGIPTHRSSTGWLSLPAGRCRTAGTHIEDHWSLQRRRIWKWVKHGKPWRWWIQNCAAFNFWSPGSHWVSKPKLGWNHVHGPGLGNEGASDIVSPLNWWNPKLLSYDVRRTNPIPQPGVCHMAPSFTQQEGISSCKNKGPDHFGHLAVCCWKCWCWPQWNGFWMILKHSDTRGLISMKLKTGFALTGDSLTIHDWGKASLSDRAPSAETGLWVSGRSVHTTGSWGPGC